VLLVYAPLSLQIKEDISLIKSFFKDEFEEFLTKRVYITHGCLDSAYLVAPANYDFSCQI
jgi:hypothetical protein